ncbi:hypothetical protein FSARC_8353 [Fusarium sarcochroum]|uniref:P-loop containing nucleoside triphosphate hydrolase protein n=1 Tax=Fusarium sarcochroum TaxID=1208366 RepID=A0A8H4X6F9_9HYPO|nr:hypothetical protein FSARC_8353 [Fusarium sarcochroum]
MSDIANPSSKPMQVLSLGLPRTGSASIAKALTMLGYKDVYHGIEAMESPSHWSLPFTREEWDELWGHCEAVTDVGSAFAPQLIEAYPDAKVILTGEEARQKGRETYERHHRVIREMVPRERLLEYRMGEGWGPICDFLDKPVPDEEFPWVNEAAELKRVISDKFKSYTTAAAMVVLHWAGAAAVVGVGLWMMLKR